MGLVGLITGYFHTGQWKTVPDTVKIKEDVPDDEVFGLVEKHTAVRVVKMGLTCKLRKWGELPPRNAGVLPPVHEVVHHMRGWPHPIR